MVKWHISRMLISDPSPPVQGTAGWEKMQSEQGVCFRHGCPGQEGYIQCKTSGMGGVTYQITRFGKVRRQQIFGCEDAFEPWLCILYFGVFSLPNNCNTQKSSQQGLWAFSVAVESAEQCVALVADQYIGGQIQSNTTDLSLWNEGCCRRGKPKHPWKFRFF